MRTDAQRIAAYNARMQSTLVDPTLTAVNTNAQANFGAYMAEFYPKQVLCAGILDTNAIPNYQRGRYMALLGQLYHAWKVDKGAGAIADFTSIVAKWEARGLGHGGMKQICSVCFGVTIA